MKKALYVFFALALVLGLAVSPVSAAAPVDYESSIQVRNLSADAGEITLVFYDLTGAPVGAPVVDPIAGNETLSYYQGTMPVVDGFDGSVVVSSLLPIAAMSNLVGLNSTGGQISYAAYGGFSGTTTFISPPVLRIIKITLYYVQNTGGVATDEASPTAMATNSTGLQPGQSAVVIGQMKLTRQKSSPLSPMLILRRDRS